VQSRTDNPEKLSTLGTEDTGQRQTQQKQTQHRTLKRGATRINTKYYVTNKFPTTEKNIYTTSFLTFTLSK